MRSSSQGHPRGDFSPSRIPAPSKASGLRFIPRLFWNPKSSQAGKALGAQIPVTDRVPKRHIHVASDPVFQEKLIPNIPRIPSSPSNSGSRKQWRQTRRRRTRWRSERVRLGKVGPGFLWESLWESDTTLQPGQTFPVCFPKKKSIFVGVFPPHY